MKFVRINDTILKMWKLLWSLWLKLYLELNSVYSVYSLNNGRKGGSRGIWGGNSAWYGFPGEWKMFKQWNSFLTFFFSSIPQLKKRFFLYFYSLNLPFPLIVPIPKDHEERWIEYSKSPFICKVCNLIFNCISFPIAFATHV